MNCARKKRLQPSQVLFLYSVILCSLCQPIISARLNAPHPLPQVGKDLEEYLDEAFEQTAKETQGQRESLTTTQIVQAKHEVMAETYSVHHHDTADVKASDCTPPLSEQTFVHCTSVTTESFTDTIPASSGKIQNVRSKYPSDPFTVKERRQGWLILHIIGVMYMFLSVVIVCDKFFVPALGVITDKLSIADDVTGATFMATGVSAHKLLAILIGVVVTRGNVFFFGTLVCSAVFNILFVIGLCALFSREVLHLTRWPLLRDTFFFILCIIVAIIIFLDSVIMWWESVLLVFCFALYLVILKFNKETQQIFKTQPHKHKNNVEVISVQEQEKTCVSEDLDLPKSFSVALCDEDNKNEDLKDCAKYDGEDVYENRKEDRRESPLSLDWPDTRLKQATYLLLLPIIFPLWLTIPDVRNQKSRKFFVVTFLSSILWIAVFSYFMVWWTHQVGETVGIPDLIVTSVAAEASIPGLITSVIVARKGLGDMAVSSSMGSNIFSISVCLPVQWLLISAFHSFAPVPVSNKGLCCMIVLLLLPLFYVVITIASCKWRMNKVLGSTMLLFYMMFQLVRVMFQYRLIVCPV